jgi:DNA-binding CsgD family transcriptional regulator
MSRLCARDFRGVLDVLAEVYAARSRDAFTQQVNAGLCRLIPSDSVGYNEINPRARRIRYVVEPAEVNFPGSEQVFGRHMHEHPIIAYHRRTGSGPTVKLSDFMGRRQLHDLGLHTEFFRRVDVEDLIAVTLPSPAATVCLPCMPRGPRLHRARPPRPGPAPPTPRAVVPERRGRGGGAETARWLELGIERSSRGVVVLGRGGRVHAMTHGARRWLLEYWGRPARRADRLPPPVREWVRRDRARASLAEPRAPMVAERDGKRLTLRLVSDLLLLEEQRTVPDAAALAALGLTRREPEVLAWVAEGKSNGEIGWILGLSGRTVGKHLERVYAKLGVESRTAAARAALSV